MSDHIEGIQITIGSDWYKDSKGVMTSEWPHLVAQYGHIKAIGEYVWYVKDTTPLMGKLIEKGWVKTEEQARDSAEQIIRNHFWKWTV